MNGGDHDVEPLKNRIRQVEPAVREDVDLDTLGSEEQSALATPEDVVHIMGEMNDLGCIDGLKSPAPPEPRHLSPSAECAL